jgi:hypothetical protein
LSFAKIALGGSGWDYLFDANDQVTGIQITGPACERIEQGEVARIDLAVCDSAWCC